MMQVPFSHLQIGPDSVPDIVKICIKRCITVLKGGQWDAAEVSKFATVCSIVSFAFEVPHDGILDPEIIHGSFSRCHCWYRTDGRHGRCDRHGGGGSGCFKCAVFNGSPV